MNTRCPTRLLLAAFLAFGALAPGAVARPLALQGQQGRERTVQAHLIQSMRQALGRCDWARAIELASLARQLSSERSDAWLDATAAAARAHYMRAEREAAMALARQASAAIARRDAGEPEAGPWPQGPLSDVQRIELSDTELIAAGVLQHEEMHEEALARLVPLIGSLRKAGQRGRVRLASALLDAARSLSALGREEEAREHLAELRDRHRDLPTGAVACVLLQQGPEGAGSYRGKYHRADPSHDARMQAVREALPAARRELARRLAREEESLPAFPVGVADRPSGVGHIGGFTMTDSRSGMVPAIVLFSEVLALELLPLDDMLVHELAHALLSQELGPRYDVLPGWVAEGISAGLAGQWEGSARTFLANRLKDDPRAFADASFIEDLTIDLADGPCRQGKPLTDLALWCLEAEDGEGEALLRLVSALYGGRTLDEALRETSGMDAGEFLAFAAHELRRRLARRWEAMRPFVLDVLAAEERSRTRGLGQVIEACEVALAGGAPDGVLGFLLWRKVKALELTGRLEEALQVHARLRFEPLAHPTYSESCRMGRIWCLLALGHEAEAYVELLALRRDSLSSGVVRWAEERIAELGGPARPAPRPRPR